MKQFVGEKQPNTSFLQVYHMQGYEEIIYFYLNEIILDACSILLE